MASCPWCSTPANQDLCPACCRVFMSILRRQVRDDADLQYYIGQNDITPIENIIRATSSARIAAVKLFVEEYGSRYASKTRIARRRIRATVKDPVRKKSDALQRDRMEKYIIRNTEDGIFQPTLEAFVGVFGCRPPKGIFKKLGVKVCDD